MEIQFEQNRDFNQSHRDDKQGEHIQRGQPQGREGDPNQRIVKSEELNNEEKGLDRRPADAANGNIEKGDDTSSAIPGMQSDQQNSTRNSSKPDGEAPNYSTEMENNQNKEERW
ncbi:MAG: hypothetical protein EOO93_00045 [Pedobacter sp.]|nr:MAG: hypothetical protein EOO93_00045 [Pedobacter sp.]